MANQKERCFKILAIDDDPAVLEALAMVAKSNNFNLTGVNSLEGAQKLINEGRSFQGFIFDVVCNTDDEQSSPSPDFISDALDYAKKNFAAHPRVIITGHSDHYEGVVKYHPKEKIIEKGNVSAITGMFQWFRIEIGNLRETKIKDKYSDAWEVFDQRLLASDIENELLETLMQMDNHNLTTIKDNLARIRRIFESIYIEISKRREDIIPVKMLRGEHGELRVTAITNHLKGDIKHHGYMDGVIAEFSSKVWSVASDNGSHTPYEKPEYMPTKYTVQSITYALLDILLWMKSILNKSK